MPDILMMRKPPLTAASLHVHLDSFSFHVSNTVVKDECFLSETVEKEKEEAKMEQSQEGKEREEEIITSSIL